MKNLEKFRNLLKEGELDGILLTSRVSRLYCAEYDIAEGIAILSQDKCRYFTDSRYIEAAQNNLPDFEVEMVGRSAGYSTLLQKAIDAFGIQSLGFEEEAMTVAEFSVLDQALSATLVPCQRRINRLRWVKEDWEIARMRKAQEITDRTFSGMLTKLKAGMTEKEARSELIYLLYQNGADGLAFDPIVISGPNTSMPHGVAGDRRLQPGDFITMDFGALYQGYCADMTRTVALGYATEEMEKVYGIVLNAQKAAIAATKAGTPGRDIDAIARDVIANAGYGDCFGHGYGHGVGLEIHEAPNCNTANDQPMPAGAVCSAEPGIYLPGKFGVRIEDVVIFTETGCIDITESAKQLIVL